MEKRVEGVYPTVDEALKAVDNLRLKGYTRESIEIVANEEVRNSLDAYAQDNVTIREENVDYSEDDRSLWDSIKDFFRPDDADMDENDPIYLYRDEIKNGKVVVLVSKDKPIVDRLEDHVEDPMPNTIGPDGVRDYDEEQKIESKGTHPRTDKELTQDELDDYERRQ